MRFDPERAAIRFGCGLSPSIAPPGTVDEMLQRLHGPDEAAKQFPIPDFSQVHEAIQARRMAARLQRKGKSDQERQEAKERRRSVVRNLRDEAFGWFGQSLLRRALTRDAFRERLAFFWADHFTARGKDPVWLQAYMPYMEDVIRPHVAGRFAEMLKAAVTHPLMLHFLDQSKSVGPQSPAAERRPRLSGLNENLARELLELHTLGVGGNYTQQDVRELAELLTGLTFDPDHGFRFLPPYAEPGAETVLGQTYGGGAPALRDVHAVLDDLALHPDTAGHLSRKLAVHFVSDTPDPGLVEAMKNAYLQTGGDLPAVYAAMLRHPAAWHDGPGNVKQPIDFVGSTLRALDLVPRHVPMRPQKLRRHVLEPMALMGQPWGQPLGPDGWPEADTAWITPQRMAARVQWAMTVPFLIRRLLPDPRDFVTFALGQNAPEPVRFAAASAETRAEGVGLVLASPAFQRM